MVRTEFYSSILKTFQTVSIPSRRGNGSDRFSNQEMISEFRSQSPQGGAMVRTRQVLRRKQPIPGLNPLKAGQWFGLWGFDYTKI